MGKGTFMEEEVREGIKESWRDRKYHNDPEWKAQYLAKYRKKYQEDTEYRKRQNGVKASKDDHEIKDKRALRQWLFQMFDAGMTLTEIALTTGYNVRHIKDYRKEWRNEK